MDERTLRYEARLTTFVWCPACNATHSVSEPFKHNANCPTLAASTSDAPYAFWLGKDGPYG